MKKTIDIDGIFFLRASFEQGNFGCLLDIQMEKLSRIRYIVLEFKREIRSRDVHFRV